MREPPISNPCPIGWIYPSSYGGYEWPRPRRRPPPRDPGGGPPGEDTCEGRAEAAQGSACLPHAPPLCCRVA